MRDLIKSIKTWLAIVARVVKPVFDFWIESVKIWWNLVIVGGLQVAGEILAAATPALQPIVDAFVTAVETSGPPIAASVKAPVAALAAGTFNTSAANLTAQGPSTPDNAAATAAAAFAEAFGFGISSAAVTAAFEAAFPEKLNVLNGVGPMLANMAGFEEISKAVLEPLYANAFGRSLEYKYRSLFKPELPDEADAVTWHSRRLLTDDQLRALFQFSGLKPEYEGAFVASAYRAIQPRAIVNLLADAPFPAATIKDVLEFAGLRPQDVDFMLPLLQWNSVKNVRQEYISAAVRSTELGTMTPAELDTELTTLKYSDEAKNLIQLTVATRKLEQLAELYRKSISEAYRYGQITDAQYVPALEAIGIGEADARAHYAIDSIALRGRTAIAAQRAEARLEAQRTRAATQAATASYRAGTIDEAALSAALIAAGVDPEIAAFIVTVQTERRLGPMTFVYGLELPRNAALVLKEKVTAIEEQYKKQLITDADAYNALAALNIPTANADALIAAWAALKTKPTTTGELLPR